MPRVIANFLIEFCVIFNLEMTFELRLSIVVIQRHRKGDGFWVHFPLGNTFTNICCYIFLNMLKFLFNFTRGTFYLYVFIPHCRAESEHILSYTKLSFFLPIFRRRERSQERERLRLKPTMNVHDKCWLFKNYKLNTRLKYKAY